MILDVPEHGAVAEGRGDTAQRVFERLTGHGAITAPNRDGWRCAIPAVRITKVVGLAVGHTDPVPIHQLQALPSMRASADNDGSCLEHPHYRTDP